MCRLLLGAGLFLLLIQGFVAGARLVGDSKCTWGPSYWCRGLPQSAKCGATRHCIEQLWNSNPYPDDDDEVCKICKEMVKEARDQLESNETQLEIKEVFEGSCKLIPIRVIAEECIKLADEFIVELVETLASEMDPDTVCAVSGLCNSGRIDNLIKQYQESLQSASPDCDVCLERTRKMSWKVFLMEKNDVLDKGLEMCGHMSSYSDACKLVLIENIDNVYEALTHLDFACDFDAICRATSKIPSNLATNDELQCEFCEKVIQHWIDEWKSNTTMEEFKEVLDSVCKKLGQPERIQRCLHIVDAYYIPVFKYVLTTLRPHVACAAVGLCGPNGFMEVDSSVPISVMLPHDAPLEQKKLVESDDLGRDSETRLIGGYFAPQTALEMAKPGCVICEFVLYRLREWMQDEHTQDEIQKELHSICSVMPSSVEDQCGNFVNKYGPAIAELIIEGADPEEVCNILDLCNSKEEKQQLDLGVFNPIVEMKKREDNCATCQYVTSMVMEAITNKDDQDEIRNVLDSVCTLMPSSIVDRCENFVNTYAEKILTMIADNLTPEQICEGLDLCERRPIKNDECVICEYVISTLDRVLEDRTNEDEIKQALENVCNYLPKTVTKECVQFVDTYTEVIIDLLTHGASPEEMCTEIGLCKGIKNSSEEGDSSEEKDSASDESDEKEDRPFCLLCEYAIGEVDQLIKDKHNEEEVKEALDRICYKLSKPITKECVLMVNKYMDKIIDMFVKDYTPEDVCSNLKLCDKTEVREHLLETEMSNQINQDFEMLETDVQVVGSGFCTICEFGMSVLENEILNNRTLDIAERTVLMLCAYLPRTVSEECEEFVEQYGEQIIHLIVDSELSPEEICAEIGVCSPTTTWDASSVGGVRSCEWGPAFWCQSAFHVKACGTAEYCRQRGKINF